MARLCPLFSGSGGNSYYIGSRSAGLLIDAGRSARQLDRMLQRCGIDPMAIQGILITHEHSDHIAGVRVFAKKYGIPVFASQGTLLAMQPSLEGVESWVLEGPLQLAGMEVTPFATPHDSAQSLGFRIQTADGRQFALATDLGVVTPCVREHLLGAEFVVLESNHDREMLRNGPYPAYLKRRILAGTGHLSNGDCAAFLPELARRGPNGFCWPTSAGRTTRPPWPGRRPSAPFPPQGTRRARAFGWTWPQWRTKRAKALSFRRGAYAGSQIDLRGQIEGILLAGRRGRV